MNNPPKKRAVQSGYIHTAVRLPPELRAELAQAAEANGRSTNAEIVARLQNTDAQQLRAEVAELHAMLRQVLDIVRDKL